MPNGDTLILATILSMSLLRGELLNAAAAASSKLTHGPASALRIVRTVVITVVITVAKDFVTVSADAVAVANVIATTAPALVIVKTIRCVLAVNVLSLSSSKSSQF